MGKLILHRCLVGVLQEHFEWTVGKTITISWTGPELAKLHLNHCWSIHTTRILYRLLNVAIPKGKMGQNNVCPYCGYKEEGHICVIVKISSFHQP